LPAISRSGIISSVRLLVSLLLAGGLLVLPVPGGGGSRRSSQRPGARPAAEAASHDAAIEALGVAAALLAASSADEPGTPWVPPYPRFLKPLVGEAPPAAPPGTLTRRVRELVLTFDDGPDLFGTPVVMDTLDRRGLKGIFFVNGRLMAGSKTQDLARRDLVRKLAAHGHLVANHSLTHQNLCRSEDLDREIDGNAELIAAATGVRPLLFRAPYGTRCRRLDEAVRVRDLVQVGWNLDPQEWRGGDEDAVYEYVVDGLRRLQGRSILLLHDTHPGAVRALPRVLDWIDRENDRVAREGGMPILVRDYAVFLPPHDPGEVGFEPFAVDLLTTVAALPGLGRALLDPAALLPTSPSPDR
jgi:peptidoglycan/xylan/chitin deacetylase (PgdA/CDA1 family)